MEAATQGAAAGGQVGRYLVIIYPPARRRASLSKRFSRAVCGAGFRPGRRTEPRPLKGKSTRLIVTMGMAGTRFKHIVTSLKRNVDRDSAGPRDDHRLG